MSAETIPTFQVETEFNRNQALLIINSVDKLVRNNPLAKEDGSFYSADVIKGYYNYEVEWWRLEFSRLASYEGEIGEGTNRQNVRVTLGIVNRSFNEEIETVSDGIKSFIRIEGKNGTIEYGVSELGIRVFKEWPSEEGGFCPIIVNKYPTPTFPGLSVASEDYKVNQEQGFGKKAKGLITILEGIENGDLKPLLSSNLEKDMFLEDREETKRRKEVKSKLEERIKRLVSSGIKQGKGSDDSSIWIRRILEDTGEISEFGHIILDEHVVFENSDLKIVLGIVKKDVPPDWQGISICDRGSVSMWVTGEDDNFSDGRACLIQKNSIYWDRRYEDKIRDDGYISSYLDDDSIFLPVFAASGKTVYCKEIFDKYVTEISEWLDLVESNRVRKKKLPLATENATESRDKLELISYLSNTAISLIEKNPLKTVNDMKVKCFQDYYWRDSSQCILTCSEMVSFGTSRNDFRVTLGKVKETKFYDKNGEQSEEKIDSLFIIKYGDKINCYGIGHRGNGWFYEILSFDRSDLCYSGSPFLDVDRSGNILPPEEPYERYERLKNKHYPHVPRSLDGILDKIISGAFEPTSLAKINTIEFSIVKG